MNKCSKCGTEFEGKFCPECGTAASVKSVCPLCGSELKEGVKYCTNCGCNLAERPQPAQDVQTVVVLEWRNLLRYLPLVLFALWAILLWAFFASTIVDGDGFFVDRVNLYQMFKDDMMVDLYSSGRALIVFAAISDAYLIALIFAYWKGSRRVCNIFLYASYALYLAVIISASVLSSDCKTFTEGVEEMYGSLPAVVISLTAVFAFLQAAAIFLTNKYPAQDIERNAPRQRKSKPQKQQFEVRQWFGTHRGFVVVVSILLLVAIVLSIGLTLTFTNKFRASKVEQIQLGDDYARVEQILGEPFASTEVDYYYYSKNAVKKMKELSGLIVQMDNITNFSQLSKLESQAERLEAEINALEYKYIYVSFTDGKVTGVFLNTKHTPEASVKQTKSVEVSELPLYSTPEYAKLYATIYYTDGSYSLGAIDRYDNITKYEGGNNIFGNVEWNDAYGSYSAEVRYGNEIGTGSQLDVVLDPNGGHLSDEESQEQTVIFGRNFTLPVPTRNGFVFEGWYLGDQRLTDGNGRCVDKWNIAEKRNSPVARYSATKYTITYHNVEDAANPNPISYTAEDRDIVLQPAIKSGYIFMGWYSDANLQHEAEEIDTAQARGIDLWAKYTTTKIKTNVNNSDAGTVTKLKGGYYIGEQITVTATTNPGYTFVGWYIGDQRLTDSLTYTFTMSDLDATLTATWTITDYFITYNYNSNIGDFKSEAPATYTIEGTDIPDLVAHSGNGHYFVGWETNDGTVYKNKIPKGIYGDLVLTAIWDGEHTYDNKYKCTLCGKLKEPYSEVDGEVKPYTMDKNGMTLTFGMYPQSKVTDNALKSMLNAAIINKKPSAEDANGWTDYKYYIGFKVCSYMWYIDFEYGGNKYRGVYFTSYRPRYTSYDCTANDSYQDDNGYNINTVYWFKWEPITWRILSNDGNKAMVMADLIIDSQQFDTNSNNYAQSDIRAWLNGTFYNAAFDMRSKEFIIPTTVDNSAATTERGDNPYACENTLDNVFLLSNKESSSIYRLLITSSYAQCQGVYTYTDGSNSSGNGQWWLRSPDCINSSYANYVNYKGGIDDSYTDYAGCGVVPALQIRL